MHGAMHMLPGNLTALIGFAEPLPSPAHVSIPPADTSRTVSSPCTATGVRLLSAGAEAELKLSGRWAWQRVPAGRGIPAALDW